MAVYIMIAVMAVVVLVSGMMVGSSHSSSAFTLEQNLTLAADLHRMDARRSLRPGIQ